jgi:SPP1 family predicted phage head-tail adaptor
MDIGKRDRRVVILRAGVVDTGLAREEGEFVEIGKRWANRRDLSDRERMLAAQQGADATTRFNVASDSLTRTITASDRLVLDDVVYAIVGKPREEADRRDGIEITAVSR